MLAYGRVPVTSISASWSFSFIVYGLVRMILESDVCNTTSMYAIQNWCIPDEIDLCYWFIFQFVVTLEILPPKKNSIQMFVNRKMRIQKYIFTKSVRWFSRHSWPLFKDRQEKCLSLKRTTDCCRSEWAWSERARQLSNQQRITL